MSHDGKDFVGVQEEKVSATDEFAVRPPPHPLITTPPYKKPPRKEGVPESEESKNWSKMSKGRGF